MADNKYPPAYGNDNHLSQPSQAYLDPSKGQQNTFSPSPGPSNQGGGPYGAPPQGYAQDNYGQDRGMHYGPPQGGYYQQGPYPPQGPYQQGPYQQGPYQQGPYQQYPPQNGYYERKDDRDKSCCAIFLGTLAACCCLDICLF